MKKSLAFLFLVSFVIILIGMVGIYQIVDLSNKTSEEPPNIVNILDRFANKTLLGIDRAVSPAVARSHKLSRSVRLQEALKSGDLLSVQKMINDEIVDSTEIDIISIFDASGKILAVNTVYSDGKAVAAERTDKIMKMSFEGRDIIQSCVKNDSKASVLEFQTTCDMTPAYFDSSGLSVAYSIPIHDSLSGEKLGVVSTRMRFERLQELLGDESIADGMGKMFFVTDAGGYFSEGINRSEEMAPILKDQLSQIVKPLGANGTDRQHLQLDIKDHAYHLALYKFSKMKTLENGGISLMFLANQDWVSHIKEQSSLTNMLTQIVIGLFLLCLFAFGFSIIKTTHKNQELNSKGEDLRLAIIQADAANNAKSSFLANMSHEIRTPMTAILGFSENLLDNETLSVDDTNSVNIIRRNGNYLLGLINDVLDLSKIESGKMTVENISCKPHEILVDTFELMGVRADSKGIPLIVECETDLPAFIESDPTKIRQILINLIGNSIKFTEVGSVTIRTRFVADRGEWILDVIDTGLGMTEDQVNNLFQPFMQADNSTTRKFGGTGLGLTISKRFSEMLGGSLCVAKTEAGVGTTFRVVLPTPSSDAEMVSFTIPLKRKVEHVKSNDLSLYDLTGFRILLAEDGPDNQRLISHVLKKAGAEVVVKENGQLALDAAMESRKAGDGFDVILMDMQMPVMDGYLATSELRKRGYAGAVIALTANAMSGDRDKCLAAGCDDYGSKPIDRKKLCGQILAVVEKKRAA